MPTPQIQYKKLYAIEFLRIFFLVFIILGHIFAITNNHSGQENLENATFKLFHTSSMNTGFGVEFFLVIGGFFLYQRMQKKVNPFALIKKIYTRLFPALATIYIGICLFAYGNFTTVTQILTLTTGLRIPGEATGWGDWYVGVYFWVSAFYIGIFLLYPKQGIFWTLVLIYLSVSLGYNTPDPGFQKTYYGFLGRDTIRGIYSIGIGIIVAYIMPHLKFKPNRIERIIFTLAEIGILLNVFNYIVRSSHSQLSFFQIEVLFGILLISINYSWGFLSSYLNSCRKIEYISRYSYQIFIGQIFAIMLVRVHHNYGLTDYNCALLVYTISILVGIGEYHLIENWLLPKLKQKFIKE